MSAVPKPQPVAWGPKKLRAAFEARDKWVQSMDIRRGRNFWVDERSDGKIGHAEAEGSGSFTHPLQLIDATDRTVEPNVPKVRIRYGTIGGFVISGMNVGDNPVYTIDVSGVGATGKVYADLTINSSGVITAVAGAAAATIPANTSTHVYHEIGSFTVSANRVATIAQNLTGSQAYQWCGGPLFGVI